MEYTTFNIEEFSRAKESGRKITILTAYDFFTARILEEAGIDAILVGDSLGNVVLGYKNTLPVTMEDMLHHCKAVARGAQKTFTIGDMPFMSYQVSCEEAARNAGRLVKEGLVQAVKLEGGKNMADRIKAITDAQIPVMGHLGLTPQSVNILGGYKVQGRDIDKAEQIMEDANILREAGIFALVLECVPEELGKAVSESLDIPVIGIGAGRYCDGQVLVINDMLGMDKEKKMKFVKKYAETGKIIEEAVSAYIKEVRDGNFPAEGNCFL